MSKQTIVGKTQEAVLNEDWLRTASWDVRGADGSPVTDLKGLALALGGTEAEVASELLDSASVHAAPPELVAEARAAVGDSGSLFGGQWEDAHGNVVDEPNAPEEKALPAFLQDKIKGKDKGPDTGSSTRKETIGAGAFVTWSGGRGKVEMVVTNGAVPKVDGDVSGTPSDPAARVRVYEEKDGKWVASDKRVGMKTSKLKTTAPFAAATAKKGAPEEELVTKLAEYEGTRPVSPGAVKAVFARGVKSHPGNLVTAMSPEEWGLARVDAFLVKAAGGEIEGYTRDDDLL